MTNIQTFLTNLCVVLIFFVLRTKTQECSVVSEYSAECIAMAVNNLSLLRDGSVTNTASEVNKLMDAPRIALKQAQSQNTATDKLLRLLDKSLKSNAMRFHDETLHEKNLIVQIFNLKTSSVAGIVLYKNEDNVLISSKIYRNSSLSEILHFGDFLAAAYLPNTLLEQIAEALPNPVVSITVFLKDTLFAEVGEEHKTNEIAFGVLIPGFEEEFKAPIKMAFKIKPGDETQMECAHWYYREDILGSWSQEKDSSVCGGIEICEYYHVTHFGMLVSDSTDDTKKHQTSLEIITFVGCCLSMVGLFGIFLTGMLFSKWRSNKGNIILLNYAAATLLEIIVLYVSKYVRESSLCDRTWCFLSGIFLHYFVLAQFFWVLVISYLQYKRYVQIVGVPTSRLILKACLVAWLGPLPIVLTIGVFFNGDFVNNKADLCYPHGLTLYLGIILPILIIVIVNIIVFILILKSVFHDNMEIPRLADNVTILKFRLVFLLFFQLGICWVFGFLGDLSIIFVYLFCLTAPNQGFVVFLLFIVFNTGSNIFYKEMFGCAKPRTTTQERSLTRTTN